MTNDYIKCKNKKCNNTFKIKKTKRFCKRFCSHKCQTQYNSLRRYYLLKDTPDYKQKAKQNWRRWFSKNRKRYNEYMKNYMKQKLKDNKYKEKQKEYYLKCQKIERRLKNNGK